MEPNQRVQVDSTILGVQVLDAHGHPHRCRWTVAIDITTRTIIASSLVLAGDQGT